MTVKSKIASFPLAQRAFVAIHHYKKWLTRQLSGTGQIWSLQPTGSQKGAVLIIAPGEMELPVKGWGAVELVVQRQANFFASQGFEVNVLNSWKVLDWIRAWSSQYLFAINHYDVFSKPSLFWAKFRRIPLVSTTHYAYAEQPDKWDLGFRRQVKSMLGASGFVALNPRIKELMTRINPSLKSVCIPNGVEVEDFEIHDQRENFICLGKVEPRKKQYELALALGEGFQISFIGDIVDSRIAQLPEGLKRKFKGGWSRTQVLQQLSTYKSLILLSEAEADALVLYEAQAAGLQVFASDKALGAQDRSLPWVHEIELEAPNLAEKLGVQSGGQKISQDEIRSHAVSSYGSDLSADAWLKFGLSFSQISEAFE